MCVSALLYCQRVWLLRLLRRLLLQPLKLMALSSPLAAKVVRELDLVGPTRNILDRDVRLLAQCIRRTGDLRRIKQEIWRSDAVLDGESLLELIRAVPGQQGIALVSLLGTSGMVGAEHYEQAVVNVSAEDEPEAALTLLDEMRQNGMTPSGDAYRTVLMSLATGLGALPFYFVGEAFNI